MNPVRDITIVNIKKAVARVSKRETIVNIIRHGCDKVATCL